jgi:transcriptional regulator with XRE-family HTH domain
VGIIRQVNLGFNKRRDTLPRKRTKPLQGSAFSQRITLLRKGESLTMTALAERIGVTTSYISLLEAGDRQPSREIVIKLASVFHGPDDQSQTDELLVLAGLSPVSYEMQYQTQDTRSIYEELLRSDPEDFKTFTALIRLLIRLGDFNAAEAHIYAGLKRFQDASRLQALMAQLQLCKKAFETASTFQLSAIELYRKQVKPKDLKQDPDFADLHTNLGVIYFLWGSEIFESSFLAEAEAQAALKDAALKNFFKALGYYEQAMAITPKDIFLLDEYARIRFNLADLSSADSSQPLWEAAIQAFIDVICAEDVGALGLESVREANAFLAHAHSKAGQFESARTLIGVILSCNPDYWLIYYIKACYYSLRAASGHEDDLNAALSMLESALLNPHPNNASLAYAEIDPDLTFLRQGKAKEFEQLLEKFKRKKKDN